MITRAKLSTIEQGLPRYRSMLAGNDAYKPPAFESIASATGTGSSNTITFSSIPGTFQSLQLRMLHKNTNTGNSNSFVDVRLNGSSSSIYATHSLVGDGSTVTVAGSASQTEMQGLLRTLGSDVGAPNMMGATIIDIHDYASTTKTKTLRSFSGFDSNNTNGGEARFASGLFNSTNAVTSITIIVGTGSWTTTTQFALYGIKGA